MVFVPCPAPAASTRGYNVTDDRTRAIVTSKGTRGPELQRQAAQCSSPHCRVQVARSICPQLQLSRFRSGAQTCTEQAVPESAGHLESGSGL